MFSTLSILGLALLDSLSAGTLVIPLVLVLNQRGVKVHPLAIYFLTVCLSYFAIGVVILLGLNQVRDALGDVLNSDPVTWLKLIVGAGLLAYGLVAPDPKKTEGTEVRQPRNLSTVAMVSLALSAVAIEAATMLPYLAAIAILSDAELAMLPRLSVLALYCVVMILPALACITAVTVLGDRIWPRVEKFVRWVERETKVTLMWIAAIAGIYLIATAASQLGWIA